VVLKIVEGDMGVKEAAYSTPKVADLTAVGAVTTITEMSNMVRRTRACSMGIVWTTSRTALIET
jgi:hypothetical protein